MNSFLELLEKIVGQGCVILLLLPSFIWDNIQYFSLIYKYYARSEKDTHSERVKHVQDQVKRWQTEGKGRKMCTARPSWKSISQQSLGYKEKMYRVEVDLEDVISLNKEEQYVHVEPSVCIGFLNKFLVSQGWTLPIVPELDSLTIGGLVMGGGIESTSHKYGLFHHCCTEYELVTADGSCVIASEDTNRDLYYSVPFSYGTLGFLTAVKIKIIPFKPYIKLTYRPTYSLEEAMVVFDKETHKGYGNDSVEGIMYNLKEAVIMTGQFVEKEEVEWDKVNNMGYWYKPWFYKYVETFIKKGKTIEYVPTLHFHQRHNKPCFWLTYIWAPWASNAIARYLLGWVMPINTQLLKFIRVNLLGVDLKENFVLQDFILPIHYLEKGIKLSAEITDIWPIWMVPARLHPRIPQPRGGEVMYIDLGVYGMSYLENYKGRDATLREFEKFTLDHDGYQALYAETLMTFEEYRTMFEPQLYEKVRESLPFCSEAFPDVYGKVSRDGRNGVINSKKID